MYKTDIYYQDTDAGGVVYFANYLKFFERSWFEFFRTMGIPLTELEKRGIFVMVKNVSLDLVGKLRYGDTITVETSLKELKHASFLLTHIVSKEGVVTTRGETTMLCVNLTGRPVKMPDDLRKGLSLSLAP